MSSAGGGGESSWRMRGQSVGDCPRLSGPPGDLKEQQMKASDFPILTVIAKTVNR